MYETGLEVNMTINTELETENNCEIDEFRYPFEFKVIPSYVAVIIFSLNEPVYIIKVKEKGRATVKQFQKINFDVIRPSFEILETFAEVANGFTMSTSGYLINRYSSERAK